MVAVMRFTTRLDQLTKKRYCTPTVAVMWFTTRRDQLATKRYGTPLGSSDEVYHQTRPTGQKEVRYPLW